MNEYEYKLKIIGFKRIIIKADSPAVADKAFWKLMEDQIVIEPDEQLDLITSGPYPVTEQEDLLEDLLHLNEKN